MSDKIKPIEQALSLHAVIAPGVTYGAMDDYKLQPHMLAFDGCRALIEVARELWRDEEPVDAGVVASRLPDEHMTWLVESMGAAALAPLNPAWICRRLVAAHRDREGQRRLGELGRVGRGKGADEVADLAETRLVQPIREERPASHGDVAAVIERRLAGEPPARHIASWGVNSLDRLLGGIRATKQIVVGGRPGQGKTALALQAVVEVLRSGGAALVACVEMGEQELLDRLLANYSGVPFGALHDGKVGEQHESDVVDALAWFERRRLRLMCGPVTIEQVCSQARSLRERWGRLDLVVVDYAQNLTPGDPKLRRYQQLGQVSRSLKNIAVPLDCATLLLSQLRRDEGKPKMTDLKESGDIEQEADAIVLIHRERADLPAAELLVPKCRYAKTGVVEAYFDGKHMRWS